MKSGEFRLLSDLMKHIHDVIYFKDRSGRLILVNDAHARGLGLKPEDVAGKTDFDIFPKERAELMARDDRYVMRTGKPIIDKIERSTRPDGIDNYVSTTKIPRYDETGRVIGIIGITRDITRRMRFEGLRAEKELIEKKLEAAEELSRIKSEFISVVSHELRTPLAIIKEAVLLLLDEIAGKLSEKQREMLLRAKSNVGRLSGIINELLDISRIESANLKLHYSLVNLNNLLKESSDFFKKMAGEKGVTLTYHLPREGVNIFLDSDRIHQVVSNLVSNAIKFTDNGGSVRVELEVLQDRVRVGVIDTGIGIAASDIPKLFNKFTQVSGICAKERKGLGLGLAIARELITRHAGEVWVESRLGAGSRFYFTLPRLQSRCGLDTRTVNWINNALARGAAFHYVNLKIIRYDELINKRGFKPKALFGDLRVMLERAMGKYFRSPKENGAKVMFLDSDYGECGFLLPKVSERQVESFSKEISVSAKKVFLKNKLENVFTNIGSLSYPEEGVGAQRDNTVKERLSANLKLWKIYIGSQERKKPRIRYRADVQILLSADRRIYSHAIDISTGGICFSVSEPLRTDAEAEIMLRFPGKEMVLPLKGSVAWMREIPGIRKEYMVGLKFTRLNKKDKSAISRLISHQW